MVKTMHKITVLLSVLSILLCTDAKAQDKSVYIEGYDRLRYSVEEIKVNPGAVVEITFKTVSNLPKSQMAHNWLLLKKDVDTDEFVKSGQSHKDNNYVDPSKENQIIATTGMLGGGEQKSITFTAPETKGTYLYICTFPGHYEAGMKGQLIVQ